MGFTHNKKMISEDWGKKPPDLKDMAQHPAKSKDYFEWWYFDGELEDGRTFVIVFHGRDFIAGKPTILFSLYSENWSEKMMKFETLEPGQFKASAEDLLLETPVGFVRRISADKIQVNFEFNGDGADLLLTTTSPGWMPRGSGAIDDKKLFFWTIHQAKNRIEGTIKAGNRTTVVSGSGYSDHNWGYQPIYKAAKSWVWGRIITEKYTIIYADVDLKNPGGPKGASYKPLYIAKDNKVLHGIGNPEISKSGYTYDKELGRSYPELIEINFVDEKEHTAVKIKIEKKELVEKIDLLEPKEFGKFVHKFVRTFITRPSYFRIVAEFEGYIQHENSKEEIAGTSLYEVMILY